MIIEVKVIANSHENKVVGFEENVLKVKCTAPPEKGKANTAIISLLAEHYEVRKNDIRILWGKTNSRKLIEIDE